MKKLILGVSAAALLSSQPGFSKDIQRFIVKFKPSVGLQSVNSLSSKLGLKVESKQAMAAGLTILTIDGDKSAYSALKSHPSIEYAIIDKQTKLKQPKILQTNLFQLPDHRLQWDQFLAPAGTMLESSPGAKDGAWSYSLGESNPPVVVAVIDTGVEPNERLVDNFLHDQNNNVIGWNFAGNNSDISDETISYHGTHVAGTIAASGDDVFGMGPKLKILPVKIPDDSGLFYESAVINGIYWALGEHVPGVPDNPYPARVMNMSFGIDEGPGKEVEKCDTAVQDAIDYAVQKGAVMVVAAGNNNMEDDLGAPAGCRGTIRVSSTGPTGLRAYYSNYGRGVSYAAPGGDKHFGTDGGILSTVKPGSGVGGSGLAFMQGTSMASPHVAGLFGLVFAANNDLTVAQAQQIVYSTTHNFGDKGSSNNNCRGKKACGHGIIDADAALAAIDRNYRFMLNAPAPSKLGLTSDGCPAGMKKASVDSISEEQAGNDWQIQNNACVSKAALDFPQLVVMDFAVTAKYGPLSYRIYPQGHCQQIGWDGVGCH